MKPNRFYRWALHLALAVAGLFAFPVDVIRGTREWSAPYLAKRLTREGGAYGASETLFRVKQAYQRTIRDIGFGNSSGLRKEKHGFRQVSADEYGGLPGASS